MRTEDRDTLIAIMAIILVFVGIFAGVSLYSNHSPPFSVVISQSMQHDDNQSQIGVIDTGDMVLVRDKSKVEIQTYIEGYTTGHSTFGDYGSVIIYKNNRGINIIHRAMMYMEIKDDGYGKYADIPYLDQYPSKSDLIDYEKIRTDFFIERIGYKDGTKIYINIENILSRSEEGDSGYITMGDNNMFTDQQNSSIIPGVNGLVTYEKIVAIPTIEIPWLGCFKLLIQNENEIIDNHAPNSLPNLAIVIITGFLTLLSLYSLHIVYHIEKSRRKKE